MDHRLRSRIAVLVCAGSSSVAAAQPTLIITGTGTDLASGGNAVSGLVYDADAAEYIPYTWQRGVGYARIPGATFGGSSGVFCSSDAGVLAMAADNTANWGDLNCFNGYCFGSMAGCTPGEPRPPQNPCWVPAISHRWTNASGWVNAGSFDRVLDSATGRWYGGTRCDGDINQPNDLSGDGRYLVGGAWWAPLMHTDGGPGFGLCGHFYAFRYDSLTGAFDRLPSSSNTTRADRVNHDGSVITGYDLDAANSLRRTSVWRNGVQTIIDPYLGAKDNAAVNGPGTFVASGASPEFVATTFPPLTGVRLVRWAWTGSAWSPQNLGRPASYIDPSSGVPIACSNMWAEAVSDDGNTIVGTALYGAAPPVIGGIFRPFIWSTSINAGVPIDLEAHLASQGSTIFTGGFTIDRVIGMSGDANAILVIIRDGRNTCTPPARSHSPFTIGVVYRNGTPIACDPPRIGLDPKDWIESHDYPFGVSLNVTASGSWPLTYQWQREDPANPGAWLNLAESCSNFDDSNWDYEGVGKNQLRIGQHFGGGGRGGRYRVVISNACGSVASAPATVTFRSGACCAPGTVCEIKYQEDCVHPDVGGIYLGDAVACGPTDPCLEPSGACCRGATCEAVLQSACTGANTSFSGGGTVCNAFGGDNTAPCCLADYNHIGGVTVQDIFDFLGGYFSQSPHADINGGGVSVQDIFDYLSVYFAAC